jgi:hypothetical protein
MTAWFEFELDTTKPVDAWREEVAANLPAAGSPPPGWRAAPP